MFRNRLAIIAVASAALFPAALSAAPPCQVSGGGCIDVPGQPPRHVQATFGGLAGHDSGGTWEHVYRDGRTVLFNFKSDDATVRLCRPDANGACRPPDLASRSEVIGTGTFTTATDTVPADGNFQVELVDKGSCEGDVRDSYSITIRRGFVVGQGEIVHSMAGDLACGNLTIDAPWSGPAAHANKGAESP